jgi:1-acyl-sn-glycerol-3-phosphate acyltransferase
MSANSHSMTVMSGELRPFQQVARFLLRLIGWRAEGALPGTPKFVLVVAHHTSNWDVPIGLLCAYALGLLYEWPYGFMIKAHALRWPVVGPLLRWFGGIPIDRSAAHNVVEQMVDVFERSDRLMLAITPEGTRQKRGYWKSGFYHIALGARVPIVLAYLDFKRKAGGLGPIFWPTGDVEADLQVIRDFYAGVTAMYPDQVGEVRFKPQEAQA